MRLANNLVRIGFAIASSVVNVKCRHGICPWKIPGGIAHPAAPRRSAAVNCGHVFGLAVDGENGVVRWNTLAIPPYFPLARRKAVGIGECGPHRRV
jgi:hypothetical protein